MFENAENLTDPRRNGRPEIDRFAGVLSVLAYDAHKGVFLLNAGGQTPPCALGRVLEINPVLWADETLTSVRHLPPWRFRFMHRLASKRLLTRTLPHAIGVRVKSAVKSTSF